MPSQLKKIANRGKPLTILALLAGIALMLFLVLAMVLTAFDKPEPVLFSQDLEPEEDQAVWTPVQFSGYQFASYTDSDDFGFYLTFSDQLDCCVLFGGEDLDLQLSPAQEYTFGLTEELPATVSITGYLRPLPEDLLPYLTEELQSFFPETPLDEAMVLDAVGGYYLDTTYNPEGSTLAALLAAVILLAFGLGLLVLRDSRRNRVTAKTCRQLSPEQLDTAAEELEQEPLRLKKTGLIVTRGYLLSGRAGLQILPLYGMDTLVCLTRGNKARLQMRLRDGSVATLPPFVRSAAAKQELERLAAALPAQIGLGSQHGRLAAGQSLEDIPGFYLSDNKEPLSLDEAVRPRYGAGFAGALLGGLAGAAVWILVGLLGYISGWAGLLMIYLTIWGFRKFGGGLDKTGALISVLMALLLVFPASYLVYAISYWTSASYVTLSKALTGVFPMMRENGLVTGFVTDLVIGYVFTALVGIPLLRRLFRAGKQKAALAELPRQDAGMAPGGAEPDEAEPADPGASPKADVPTDYDHPAGKDEPADL